MFEEKNFKGAIRKYHNALLYTRAVTNKISEFGFLKKSQQATAAEEELAKKVTTALSNNLSGC